MIPPKNESLSLDNAQPMAVSDNVWLVVGSMIMEKVEKGSSTSSPNHLLHC